MKAKPKDFEAFEEWLEARCSEGDQSAAETRKIAWEIYRKYCEARSGVIGRTCACGEPGVKALMMQPIPSWPIEPHVLCEKHAELAREYDAFCSLILKEGKEKR